MLALFVTAALAEPPPCDDPPEKKEVVKCEGKTAADPDREIDLSALLGAPSSDPGCSRTVLSVVRGSSVGVEDRLDAVEPALTGCEREARQRTPKLTGAVSLQLTVSATGKVSAVDTTSTTLSDAELAGCFERALATARFTPAARVVRVDLGCKTPAQ